MSDAPTASVTREDGRQVLLRPHGCFACGELNEHGLHLQLHVGHARCTTEFTLDERFQGWDGIAHGGIVSTILDEVGAWALLDQDSWGLTARLTIDFRRPVPIGRPLQAEGEIVERRRRVTRTRARLVDAGSGEVLARAEATYVDAPHETRTRLRERYELRLDARPAEAEAPS